MSSQVFKFVYFLLAFGVYIIYQARDKGQLDIIPQTVFWTVFLLMIVGLITIPFIRKYEQKHDNNLNGK